MASNDNCGWDEQRKKHSMELLNQNSSDNYSSVLINAKKPPIFRFDPVAYESALFNENYIVPCKFCCRRIKVEYFNSHYKECTPTKNCLPLETQSDGVQTKPKRKYTRKANNTAKSQSDHEPKSADTNILLHHSQFDGVSLSEQGKKSANKSNNRGKGAKSKIKPKIDFPEVKSAENNSETQNSQVVPPLKLIRTKEEKYVLKSNLEDKLEKSEEYVSEGNNLSQSSGSLLFISRKVNHTKSSSSTSIAINSAEYTPKTNSLPQNIQSDKRQPKSNRRCTRKVDNTVKPGRLKSQPDPKTKSAEFVCEGNYLPQSSRSFFEPNDSRKVNHIEPSITILPINSEEHTSTINNLLQGTHSNGGQTKSKKNYNKKVNNTRKVNNTVKLQTDPTAEYMCEENNLPQSSRTFLEPNDSRIVNHIESSSTPIFTIVSEGGTTSSNDIYSVAAVESSMKAPNKKRKNYSSESNRKKLKTDCVEEDTQNNQSFLGDNGSSAASSSLHSSAEDPALQNRLSSAEDLFWSDRRSLLYRYRRPTSEKLFVTVNGNPDKLRETMIHGLALLKKSLCTVGTGKNQSEPMKSSFNRSVPQVSSAQTASSDFIPTYQPIIPPIRLLGDIFSQDEENKVSSKRGIDKEYEYE